MWLSPPPEVEALKAMLLACPSFAGWGFSAAGIDANKVHYPTVSLGNSAGADALPSALIEPLEKNPKVLAPGLVMPGGKMQVVVRVAAVSAANVESIAWAICDELLMIPTGLPLLDAKVGMTAEPTADDLAAQEYANQEASGQTFAIWTIGIHITYGIT